MSGNPIKYTSRTFQTILDDINADSDLVDKPEWFKRIVAGVGDMVSMINNAAANNAFLRTAFTRQAVLDLCAQIGYEVPPAETSEGTILFYFPSDTSFPITVEAADLAGATRGTVAVSAKRFEARSSYTFAAASAVSNLGSTPISGSSITVDRDFLTGEKVRASSSVTMPTGLSVDTDYYAVRVDATHVRLASSIANAFAGTYITISGGSGNLTLTLYSGRVTCYQQESKSSTIIGQSDGLSGWQEFELPDIDVIRDTLIVTINGEQYLRTDTLATSKSTEKHFQHIYKSDGSSYIRFGNGEYGAIPGNFDVNAEYAVGGGLASNISALNSISVYSGGSGYITGCANATAMEGGADAQSSDTARRIAPGRIKSRDRFITSADGESLAVAFGGISQARVIPNAYGVLSAQVVAVAAGGGNPSSTVRSELQAYLIARTILESIDVRVLAATITSHAVTCSAKLLTGYTWAVILPRLRLAWKLFLSEAGQEIIDDYISNGVASAVEKINTIFTETFGSDDYVIVASLIDGLDKYGARTFGDTITQDDAIVFIREFIEGIDTLTITAPTFPVTHAAAEISTYGTLTLTEAT